MNGSRAVVVGIFLSLAATLLAASALAASMPHRDQLSALYAADHHGTRPGTDADLAPYSAQFQRVLASCTINSSDLANATLYMAGHASRQPGVSPVTNLAMITAISHTITWRSPKDCWDMFNRVEARLAARAASKLIVNRHQLGSLFGFDHMGKVPASDTELLPYSNSFQHIYSSCQISIDALPTQVISLSEMAAELGGRNVTALGMMKAIERRIVWKGRQDCAGVFENAEAHMESGGP